ncbi:hypothetical protein NE237_009327 [Protea cynaroides]|uniref:Transposase MuDR plant domain-containing protein n=1 Tax=Protea cynaroides TaxID=273540 RepID=A0A9Q0KXA2_9MAGN|nr:hypothetical protein NE237_009327 [Protea cynaroides]
MGDKVSIYYMCEDRTEVKLVDEDLYGWIDVVYDVYCTVLSNIPDGRNVTFSVRAEMPNGSYRDVKGDIDVSELTNFFKKEGKGIPMHISEVSVGEVVVENFTINGLSGAMIGRPRRRRPSRLRAVTVPFEEGPSTTTAAATVDSVTVPVQEGPCTTTATTTTIVGRQAEKNMASSTTTTPTSTTADRAPLLRKKTVVSKPVRKDKDKEPAIHQSSEDDGDEDNWDINVEKNMVSTTTTNPTSTTADRAPLMRKKTVVSKPVRKDKNKEPVIHQSHEDDGDEDNWEINVEDNREYSIDSEESVDGEEDDMFLSDMEEDEVEEEIGVRERDHDIDEVERVNIQVGDEFEDVYSYRRALTDFIVQEGSNVIRMKNEKNRVTIVCSTEGCPWMIHAAAKRDGHTFKVKKYIFPYSCGRVEKNKTASSAWIAQKLGSRLKIDPEMKVKSMEATTKARYGIKPSRGQLYRARLMAKDESLSNFKQSYASLQKYGESLLKRNPGSSFKLKFEEWYVATNKPIFQRVFVCLGARKRGFVKGCIPFIGIDGCHLKGAYGGILLAATAMDANNGLFLIAINVVESESKDSWTWFLSGLSDALSSNLNGKSLTFMSDKQKVYLI